MTKSHERHIAFTGSRDGMTSAQIVNIRVFMEDVVEFHHGVCIGADAQAHSIALGESVPIIGHPGVGVSHTPGTASKFRARLAFFKKIMPVELYLKRNRNMVDACGTLIAAPKECVEITRSGTWSTIRYARRTGKLVIIIWPDGKVDMERSES